SGEAPGFPFSAGGDVNGRRRKPKAFRKRRSVVSANAVPRALRPARVPERHAMNAARILLAGEQPLFRAGLRAALESGGFVVCAEADTAAAAIAAAQRERPDL